MVQPVRFSVVIPTYNRGTLVVRAARSALAQVPAPSEVLIVDDGSTDGTADAVAELGDAVRYLRKANGGVASARNHGVRLATAPWIAFLDSDDTWYDGHLARMAAAIEATGGRASLYFSDTVRSGRLEGETQWRLTGFSVAGDHQLMEDGGDWVLRAFHPMMTQSIVVPRDAYLEVGGSDERLPVRSDTHCWLKLCLGRPVCAVAGLGGLVTSDDVSGTRLTDRRGTVGYQRTTIAMYEDILGGHWPLTPGHRTEIRRRLGVAHWNLGRALLREGKLPQGLGHLAAGTGRAPVDTLRRLRRNRRGPLVGALPAG